MSILAAIASLFVTNGAPSISVNRRLDNYDMSKVSIGKMAMDSHLSAAQKRANLVAGKYDKDDVWIR